MDQSFKENFFNFLRSVQGYHWWQIALELLIIGTMVYWVVRFLQGTRGARMLKGIALVLIGLYLLVLLGGTLLGLDQLVFLYREFLGGVVLAIVVVFQPELRRALMRLGETRLFRNWSEQITDDIEQLVESATFLSRNKIGGLIAVEEERSALAVSPTPARESTRTSAPIC